MIISAPPRLVLRYLLMFVVNVNLLYRKPSTGLAEPMSSDNHAKSTTPIVERRYEAVSYLLAKNDKQLGVCLRMLYAEKIQGTVKTVMNEKGRIEFHIHANVDEQMMKSLLDRYEILIS